MPAHAEQLAGRTGPGRRHREREIVHIVTRHGLHLLGGILSVEAHGAHGDVKPERAAESAVLARELRLALEELGPTFIKLGQLLSTRADLLAPDYRRELSKLQDAAPPAPADAIRETVESELAGAGTAAFAEFDPQPLAAGSVGEAHAGVLHDGTRVVVKVRRPGVVELIERDLEIIANLAARASRRSAAAAAFDVIGLSQEFAGELRGQLDYVREACNAERFAANFAGEGTVRIPRVFWELTSSRVITLERLEGMKITDLGALEAAGVDRQELARNAALTVGKMVFVDGFFHGDPHPGNFFIDADGRLGIIDFGIVGSLDEGLRAKLRRILLALDRRDPDRLAAALIAVERPGERVDRGALRDDLAPLIDAYVGQAVGELDVGGVIRSLLDVIRRHRLRIPRDLSLLLRTVLLEEGIVAQLDRDFRLVEVLGPYARRHLLSGVSVPALLHRLQDAGVDLFELLDDLPDHLRRALEVLDDGGFDVHLRASELEPLMARAERLGNRIALSVLAAALIDAATQLLGETRHRGRRRVAGARLK
ncbi:MAG TPA: AarF/UbiB family protein [Solirubrobacteraceae bacterium]|nr:AarF/UbiB family protein [Solirubrobacteraceae bacterium]